MATQTSMGGSATPSGSQPRELAPLNLVALVAAEKRRRESIPSGCLVPEHLLEQYQPGNGNAGDGAVEVLRLSGYRSV